MASELLKGKVIAIAGIVSHNSRLLSHDLLRQQITEAGGEWCSNVVFRCTHLVATAKEYEKRSYKGRIWCICGCSRSILLTL